ncbi:hypothetical protein TOPH_09071 [Tolypocladium ophioglossoides CBS 100239]|uniref:Protein kinase domain-containing protein n=1 Tax=Tolypocladium ophioglossoides (strain CBS 100239) TaxID=1163406 RepID=A0A0L0MWJ4_TOLOC|nr:hypothetical protein TOPH_09071 [Tolypocladium ophioglossoides CBS 100239]
MAGMGWTFEELVHYFDQSPPAPGDLNPIIKQLLMTCPSSSVFGIGGHSVVLWISPDIAAKVSLQSGDERLRHEQEIFELLGQSECPQVIQCFFRGVDVSFLELIANGTLHDRISIKKPRPILQWMLQLSSAAACLEALGYAHGDINPQNILLDINDQVKLIDFDHSPRVGDMLDVGYEPYVRQHREIVGGIYGIAGPITEQFALGSVFWYMTRGSELYSELEGSDQVDRLLDGNFPTTHPQDPIDHIIRNCWNGHYLRIADLVDDIKDVLGVGIQVQGVIPPSQRNERRRQCEKYYSLVNPSHKLRTAEGEFRSKEEDGYNEPLTTTLS